MHEKIFEQQLETTKNSHVPWEYFSLAQARDVWPDVMEMVDSHQISKLMTVSTVFYPDLIKQFYANVFFSITERRERVLTWMTAETQCSATMAEFGVLIGLEVLQVAPSYVRLHLSRQLTPAIGLRHCYPPGKFTLQPKVAHMYPFWKATYQILRNCLACKFGEVSLARGMMINCLYNIYPLFQKRKQIDLLDFIWHEMKVVVGDPSRVPIYCPDRKSVV